MPDKTKDNNGADDFATRAGKAQTPAGWLRVMLEWMQAREAADERRAAIEEKRAEMDERRAAADEKRWQAWQKENKEQTRKLDKLGDLMGAWTNSEGEIFENECAAAVRKGEGLAGVHFDEVLSRLKNKYEYDLVGVNKKETMAIEVKRTLRAEDVVRFADERLPHFAELFPNYAKGRKVSGAVIFRRAPLEQMPDGETADPVAIALNKGIIPVQATGKNKLQPIADLDKVRR